MNFYSTRSDQKHSSRTQAEKASSTKLQVENLKEQRKAALKKAERTDEALKEQFEERYYRDGDKVRWERFGGDVDEDEDDEKMLLAEGEAGMDFAEESTTSHLSAGKVIDNGESREVVQWVSVHAPVKSIDLRFSLVVIADTWC